MTVVRIDGESLSPHNGPQVLLSGDDVLPPVAQTGVEVSHPQLCSRTQRVGNLLTQSRSNHLDKAGAAAVSAAGGVARDPGGARDVRVGSASRGVWGGTDILTGTDNAEARHRARIFVGLSRGGLDRDRLPRSGQATYV